MITVSNKKKLQIAYISGLQLWVCLSLPQRSVLLCLALGTVTKHSDDFFHVMAEVVAPSSQ